MTSTTVYTIQACAECVLCIFYIYIFYVRYIRLYITYMHKKWKNVQTRIFYGTCFVQTISLRINVLLRGMWHKWNNNDISLLASSISTISIFSKLQGICILYIQYRICIPYIICALSFWFMVETSFVLASFLRRRYRNNKWFCPVSDIPHICARAQHTCVCVCVCMSM